MEKNNCTEKGLIMNIKESLDIYLHKKQDQLIDEERCEQSNCLLDPVSDIYRGT
jgi:hypothetical protein